MKKVLLIRLGALGDVCLAAPVAQALQRHCEVHWLVHKNYAPLLRCFPQLQCQVIPAEIVEHSPAGAPFAPELVASLRRQQFHALLDLSHWREVAQLVGLLSEIPTRGVTVDPAQDQLLKIRTSPEFSGCFNRRVPIRQEWHQVEKWLKLIHETLDLEVSLNWQLPEWKARGECLRLFLHPHASKPTKLWPIRAFAQVIAALADAHPLHCFINSGSKKECLKAWELWVRLRLQGIRAEIVWKDRSYRRLVRVLERVDVALGCDSGPMHLASLLGTPSVVIYGPYPASEFSPLWRSRAVSPPGEARLAIDVSPLQVLSALRSLLSDPAAADMPGTAREAR